MCFDAKGEKSKTKFLLETIKEESYETCHYGKPKYSMEHMKNFLDKLQTPAEIRREAQKKPIQLSQAKTYQVMVVNRKKMRRRRRL